MGANEAIKVFDDRKIRSLWDEAQEEWYFSIVDVIAALTDSPNPQVYWRVMKKRLGDEGNQTVTNCNAFKMQAPDGKMRLTDYATAEQLFRLIQSIPSPKDDWKKRGLQDGVHFVALTDIIYKTWADKTAKEYTQFKRLKKENLRDNMTNKELVLNMLAELSTKEISEATNPVALDEHKQVAKQGDEVARNARLELESKTGKKVVTPLNAKDGILLKTGGETVLSHGELPAATTSKESLVVPPSRKAMDSVAKQKRSTGKGEKR